MSRIYWPEIRDVSIYRHTDNDGGARLTMHRPWPEFVAFTDDVLVDHDERWLRCNAQYVWLMLDNTYAQYRIIERDPDFAETLCQLEDAA